MRAASEAACLSFSLFSSLSATTTLHLAHTKQTKMTGPKNSNDNELSTRQAAGYKGVLKNATVSEEAKDHAREMLDAAGVEYDDPESKTHTKDASDSSSKSGHSAADDEHDHRVMGGYKATLHRDGVSEEAKERAREKLDAAGVEYEE